MTSLLLSMLSLSSLILLLILPTPDANVRSLATLASSLKASSHRSHSCPFTTAGNIRSVTPNQLKMVYKLTATSPPKRSCGEKTLPRRACKWRGSLAMRSYVRNSASLLPAISSELSPFAWWLLLWLTVTLLLFLFLIRRGDTVFVLLLLLLLLL